MSIRVFFRPILWLNRGLCLSAVAMPPEFADNREFTAVCIHYTKVYGNHVRSSVIYFAFQNPFGRSAKHEVGGSKNLG